MILRGIHIMHHCLILGSLFGSENMVYIYQVFYPKHIAMAMIFVYAFIYSRRVV
jgi:hypothetical protein